MSDSKQLTLKAGDKVKPMPKSIGYYGALETDTLTVTSQDGGSFDAVIDRNGVKVQGCTARDDYWTPVTAAVVAPTPVTVDAKKLPVGTPIRMLEDYSYGQKGDLGKITFQPRLIGGYELAEFELTSGVNAGKTVSCYQKRFELLTPAEAKAAKKWTAKPLSRNSKLYKTATSPALRKVSTIRKLRKKGVSVRTIAKKLGLSKSAVGRVIQRIAA